MVPFSRESRVNRGSYNVYNDEGLVSSTPTLNRRIKYEALTVLSQKLGTPNAPKINEFRYNAMRRSYFLGHMRFYTPDWRLRYAYEDYPQCEGLPAAPMDLVDYWETVDGPAYSGFLKKIRDEQTNLAVDLAEGKQTKQMVTSAMDTITSYARRIPFAPVSVMANAWLAYQYGWKPAMQTIYGVANFARTNLLQRQIAHSKTISVNRSNYPQLNQGRTILHTGTSSQTVRYGARMRVTNPPLYDLTRLTSLNPAVIAWELVPFSFVVDWFYDIGGYLADVETSLGMGYSLENIYKTYHTRAISTQTWSEVTFGYQMPPSGGSQAYKVLLANGYCDQRTYARYPLSSLPPVPKPKWQPQLGATRILSGAALLHQLFRR